MLFSPLLERDGFIQEKRPLNTRDKFRIGDLLTLIEHNLPEHRDSSVGNLFGY